MYNLPLKEQLGQAIRYQLRVSGKRQKHLAQELGVTDSAVSQLLSGRIKIDFDTLERIAKFLSIPSEQYNMMLETLHKINAGDNYSSPFYMLIQRLMTQRSLTMAKLAQATGLEEESLTFNSGYYSTPPTYKTLEVLSRYFVYPLEKFIELAELSWNINYSRPAAVAEPVEEYHAEVYSAPIISMETLSNHREGDLITYLKEHATGFKDITTYGDFFIIQLPWPNCNLVAQALVNTAIIARNGDLVAIKDNGGKVRLGKADKGMLNSFFADESEIIPLSQAQNIWYIESLSLV